MLDGAAVVGESNFALGLERRAMWRASAGGFWGGLGSSELRVGGCGIGFHHLTAGRLPGGQAAIQMVDPGETEFFHHVAGFGAASAYGAMDQIRFCFVEFGDGGFESVVMEVDVLGADEVAGGKFFRAADVEQGERWLIWMGLGIFGLLADQFDGLRRLDIDDSGGGWIRGASRSERRGGRDEQEETGQSEWFREQVHGQRINGI